MVKIHNLIAAISPDLYCDKSVRSKVKQLVKEKGYAEAAKEAKPITDTEPFLWDKAYTDALKNWGLKAPLEKHKLEYDSPGEGLEPIYFWILDFMGNFGKVEKIKDNFAATPGSGLFSEMGQKGTRMQEEAMKMLGATNQVLKSILNLMYDLKEMKLLVSTYDDLESKDPKIKAAATLTLKQRWMDLVDFAKRQTTSLKQLAAQMDYVTIIDAFMAVESLDKVDKLDLNERVKRILKQRVREYEKWVEESGKQLKQRFAIEKNYLKSQVSTLQLYSRWIKPYLEAAAKLEQNAQEQQAALVSTFSTTIFELALMGVGRYDPGADIGEGNLPAAFAAAKTREYSPVLITEFSFRGIPNRISQRGDWSFGGKTIVEFTSYALNDQELEVLKKELKNDELGSMLKLIQGATDDSLKELQEDLDEFIKDEEEVKKEKEKKEKEKKGDDVNPFSALFSMFKKPEKKKEKADLSKGIKSDNFYEKTLRSQAALEARKNCYTIFDIYKRAHRMPAHLNPYDSLVLS